MFIQILINAQNVFWRSGSVLTSHKGHLDFTLPGMSAFVRTAAIARFAWRNTLIVFTLFIETKSTSRFMSSRLESVVVCKSAVCCRLQVPSAGACLSAGIPRLMADIRLRRQHTQCLILCRIWYCGIILVLNHKKHWTQSGLKRVRYDFSQSTLPIAIGLTLATWLRCNFERCNAPRWWPKFLL